MAASARRARAEGRGGRFRWFAGLAALVALGGQTGCATGLRELLGLPTPGAVEGAVVLHTVEAEAAEALRVVVYLERLDGKRRPRTSPAVETIRQTARSFSPDLLVVSPGQTVRFANEDGVYHRIFSSSTPNAFDLGVIKSDEAREVTFTHDGVIRVYCSLHPWESGVIFVAPTALFQTLQLPGRYEIRDVPPGRYRLSTWGDALPSTNRIVTVESGQSASIELAIEGSGAVR